MTVRKWRANLERGCVKRRPSRPKSAPPRPLAAGGPSGSLLCHDVAQAMRGGAHPPDRRPRGGQDLPHSVPGVTDGNGDLSSDSLNITCPPMWTPTRSVPSG